MSKPKTSYKPWIAGRLVRLLFVLLIIAVWALLMWRIFISSKPPKEMDRLSPNAALSAAYSANGGQLSPYTQEQSTVTRGENNYGYFGVTRAVFVPEAGQVQVTFRYNNSTLKAVQEDYQLDAKPPRGEEIFDVSLLLMTDLTPEDRSDNVDGSETIAQTRIAPTDKRIDTTLLYTYILYTFDGVDVADDTVAVFFDIYYQSDVNYDAEPYGALRLYHSESPNLPVKITKKEQEAIAAYTP